jgi:GTPase SAR1 family protein
MEKHGLGPNGAQIACADMIAFNSSEIKESIESYKTDYILVDTPGQLELFVFRESGKFIIDFLNPKKSIVAYLIDFALARNASGFISQLLLSLSSNFRLNKPQINILSKSDMLSDEEKELVLRWSKDSESLYSAINLEKASIYREMSENILNMIQNFESTTVLTPTGKNLDGIEDLYTSIQFQFEGGEDLMSD